MVRRLVSAGFSIGTVFKILKNWDIDLSEADLQLPEDAEGE